MILAALVLVRVAIPLFALAAEGRSLGVLPRYEYESTPGDAGAYYFAARELIASLGRTNPIWPAAAAVAIAGSVVGAIVLVRRRRASIALAALLPAFATSAAIAALVSEMRPTGAPSVGWPLVWGAAMLPFRAAGLSLDPDRAFAFGLLLSLAANAGAVVAIAVAARRASGRQAVGLVAAGLFAFWPLLDRLVVGAGAWENASWEVETGLHMYSEPLSVALVAASLAVVLARTPEAGAVAGLLVGAAVSVRVSNALFALAALIWLARRGGMRAAAAFAIGAAVVVPIVLAYAPMSYPSLVGNRVLFPEAPFSLDYVARTVERFPYFAPRALAVLVTLSVLGMLALRRGDTRPLLVVWALLEPVLYSFYFVTWTTPRFIYASLVAVLILCAAGVAASAVAGKDAVRARVDRRAARPY